MTPVRTRVPCRLVPGMLALAAGGVWLGAPRVLTRLPADYADQVEFTSNCRYRLTVDGEWVVTQLTATQAARTLTSSGDVNVVQSEILWIGPDGALTYESTGVYGVNRNTCENVPGYGNRDRPGLFLFPPGVRPTSYELWDAFYSGPRQVFFDHATTADGLPVYVFRVEAVNMDDTAAYAFLPDVPERFRVRSDGVGLIIVEPRSGVVVDLWDEGTSAFIDPETGAIVAQIYWWDTHFTETTRTQQWQRARDRRLWLIALCDCLPGGLALAALGCVVASAVRTRREEIVAPSACPLGAPA